MGANNKSMFITWRCNLLVIMTLSYFDMNPIKLIEQAAAKYTDKVLSPGGFVTNPWDAISLGIALILGTAGLPHILMRFFTVRMLSKPENLYSLQPDLLVTFIF